MFLVRLIAPFLRPGPEIAQARAQPAVKHGPQATAKRREACLTGASTAPTLGRQGHRQRATLCSPLGMTMKRRSALAKDPVSCALMSGLQRGIDRWPSWVCAYVSGTNLSGVLEAHGC